MRKKVQKIASIILIALGATLVILELVTGKIGLNILVGACFILVGVLQLTTKKIEIALETEQRTEVENLVSQGKRIEAIKRVREMSGAGLRDAKDYVETIK